MHPCGHFLDISRCNENADSMTADSSLQLQDSVALQILPTLPHVVPDAVCWPELSFDAPAECEVLLQILPARRLAPSQKTVQQQ